MNGTPQICVNINLEYGFKHKININSLHKITDTLSKHFLS